MGTEQWEDIALVKFTDPFLRCTGTTTDCGKFLLIRVNRGARKSMMYYEDLNDNTEFTGELELLPVLMKAEFSYKYVTNNEYKFYFSTNENASNYKIIEVDLQKPIESRVRDFILEDKDSVMQR